MYTFVGQVVSGYLKRHEEAAQVKYMAITRKIHSSGPKGQFLWNKRSLVNGRLQVLLYCRSSFIKRILFRTFCWRRRKTERKGTDEVAQPWDLSPSSNRCMGMWLESELLTWGHSKTYKDLCKEDQRGNTDWSWIFPIRMCTSRHLIFRVHTLWLQ